MLKRMVLILCFLGLFWAPLEARGELKIGVAYTYQSGMAERVLVGFDRQMRSLGVSVRMTYRTGLKGQAALGRAIRDFEQTQDGILIMRSTGAKWLVKNSTTIPTFVGACNHPGQLGVINNIDAPERNITGVTYYLPRKVQWEIFRAILPEAKSIYLLLEKGHPSSDVDLHETKAICKDLGITLHYKYNKILPQAIEVIQAYREKVDAFILGTQALYIDNTDKLVSKFPHTVFLSYSGKQVENGALGGFVADDYLLGRKLANSVHDVLVKGMPFSKVPVKFDRRPKFLVNVQAAERLGVEIPFEILQAATLIGEGEK